MGRRGTSENVVLRQADWYEWPILPWSPMSAPTLGIAYEVQPIVASVVKGSPADQAGVVPGDEVLRESDPAHEGTTCEASWRRRKRC